MKTYRHLHRRGMALIVGLLMSSTASWTVAQTTPVPSKPMVNSQMSGAGSDAMQRAMKNGMEKMGQMPMSGDVDKDFAMMMRMHHQQAVDMARIEVQNGRSAEMKALANKIIKAQQTEIRQIDKYLQRQK